MNLPTLTRYWKSIAAFFGGAVVPIVAPLTQGDWPDAADYRMALGLALSSAFFVAVAPKNKAGDPSPVATTNVITIQAPDGDAAGIARQVKDHLDDEAR